jgi:hypothetical protein
LRQNIRAWRCYGPKIWIYYVWLQAHLFFSVVEISFGSAEPQIRIAAPALAPSLAPAPNKFYKCTLTITFFDLKYQHFLGTWIDGWCMLYPNTVVLKL